MAKFELSAEVRDVKGKVEDADAMRKALKAAKFASVRGAFKFNRNQYPIQNYYLRVVGKDAQGRLVNKTMGTIFKERGEAFVQDYKQLLAATGEVVGRTTYMSS